MKAGVKNMGQTNFGIYDPATLDRLHQDEIYLWGRPMVYKDWEQTEEVASEDLETFGCCYPVDPKTVPGAHQLIQPGNKQVMLYFQKCSCARILCVPIKPKLHPLCFKQ